MHQHWRIRREFRLRKGFSAFNKLTIGLHVLKHCIYILMQVLVCCIVRPAGVLKVINYEQGPRFWVQRRAHQRGSFFAWHVLILLFHPLERSWVLPFVDIKFLWLLTLNELELDLSMNDSSVHIILLQQFDLKHFDVSFINVGRLARFINIFPIIDTFFFTIFTTDLWAKQEYSLDLVFPDHLPKLALRVVNWRWARNERLFREISHQTIDITCIDICLQSLLFISSLIFNLFINLFFDWIVIFHIKWKVLIDLRLVLLDNATCIFLRLREHDLAAKWVFIWVANLILVKLSKGGALLFEHKVMLCLNFLLDLLEILQLDLAMLKRQYGFMSILRFELRNLHSNQILSMIHMQGWPLDYAEFFLGIPF